MLAVEHLTKTYVTDKGSVLALKDISFEVRKGEFVCIVGPSGCGKTTLLRCLGGLQSKTGGSIKLKGREVNQPPAEMAIVFQDYRASLMPWLTVRKNLMLPLRRMKLSRAELGPRVETALKSVGLESFMDHYPWQLSGGMQQRVAIARAIAYRPEILLMDEPFASVDAQTRADLEDLILKVRDEFNMTVLFVTHDVDEAVFLSDRVVVLSNRPTYVQDTIDVELPRPREQVTTKELPEFAHLRAQVFTEVRQHANITAAA